jgi:MFS family permease
MFFFGGAYFTILYYLPIYFQSVYNSSPIGSGVKMLALIIPLTIAAILQGVALSKIGIVPLFWIVGGTLGTIGCGLFYTMDSQTSTGKWIGYQIIVGFTCGWTFQVALSNAQVHVAPEDMSQVTAIVNCKFRTSMLLIDGPDVFSNAINSPRDGWRGLLPFGSTISLQQPVDQRVCEQTPRHRSSDSS